MTPSKGGALIIDLCSYIERRRPPVAPADRTLSTAERMIELARHVVDASIPKKKRNSAINPLSHARPQARIFIGK